MTDKLERKGKMGTRPYNLRKGHYHFDLMHIISSSGLQLYSLIKTKIKTTMHLCLFHCVIFCVRKYIYMFLHDPRDQRSKLVVTSHTPSDRTFL